MRNHQITGEAIKWICIICHHETGSMEKVDASTFPFSKFGNRIYFCNAKHGPEIEKNPEKLQEYYKLFNIP